MNQVAARGHVMIARSALLVLAVFLLSACFTVQLVPPYDEQIDRGLTELYADTSTFVDRMVQLQDDPQGSYAANQQFYSDAIGRVDSLIARAQGNQVLNNCPSTDLMARVLDAANLPEGVRAEIGSIPQGACQLVLLNRLKTNFGLMRDAHRTENRITPFLRGQFLDGGVGSLLRAAIMVEVAKRAPQ